MIRAGTMSPLATVTLSQGKLHNMYNKKLRGFQTNILLSNERIAPGDGVFYLYLC